MSALLLGSPASSGGARRESGRGAQGSATARGPLRLRRRHRSDRRRRCRRSRRRRSGRHRGRRSGGRRRGRGRGDRALDGRLLLRAHRVAAPARVALALATAAAFSSGVRVVILRGLSLKSASWSIDLGQRHLEPPAEDPIRTAGLRPLVPIGLHRALPGRPGGEHGAAGRESRLQGSDDGGRRERRASYHQGRECGTVLGKPHRA